MHVSEVLLCLLVCDTILGTADDKIEEEYIKSIKDTSKKAKEEIDRDERKVLGLIGEGRTKKSTPVKDDKKPKNELSLAKKAVLIVILFFVFGGIVYLSIKLVECFYELSMLLDK